MTSAPTSAPSEQRDLRQVTQLFSCLCPRLRMALVIASPQRGVRTILWGLEFKGLSMGAWGVKFKPILFLRAAPLPRDAVILKSLTFSRSAPLGRAVACLGKAELFLELASLHVSK